MPTQAISRPASPGPITRAALKMPEFRAMAEARCVLCTSSDTSDCRAGASTALTVPIKKAMVPITGTVARPALVIIPRARASTMLALCVK
jgi:hypothetical protein